MYYETCSASKQKEIQVYQHKPNHILIDTTPQQVMQLRNQPFIIRFHSININKHLHEYVFSELLFFVPWQSENDLQPENFDLCWELYQESQETIDKNKDKLFPHKNNITLAREILATTNKEQTSSIGNQLDANNAQQNEEDNALDKTQHPDFSHLDHDFENVTDNLSERTKYKPIDISNVDAMLKSAQQLSRDQRLAFNIVLNFCKSLIKHQNNPQHDIPPPLLMIHGGAGTGKTKLIQDISKWSEHTLTTESNR
jgi:hypothetical protein